MFSALKILFTLLLTTLFLIPLSALAKEPSQDTWKAPNQANFTLTNMEHGLLCELAGMSPVDDCTGYDQNKKVVFYNSPGGGAIGGLTTVMSAMLTTPPTSSAQYLANLGSNLGLIKPAYAQVNGSGAGIIAPVLQLWQVTRNLAYLVFIIIFVVVGFMIMFRQKMSAQAVVTVQAALPGLVIGLILVTFSYFIAALLIDVSFLGIQLVGQLFMQTGIGNAFDIPGLAKDGNILSLFTSSFRFGQNFMDVTGGVGRTIFSATGGSPMTVLIPALVGTLIGALIAGPPGAVIGLVVGGGAPILVSAVIGLIIPLILVIALVIQFFRLTFKLINAYISILVFTVTGPFMILYSSIPGKGNSLSNWWKTILANSLIFPAVFGTFLFAGLILATNPLSWNSTPPLFGSLSTELIRLIIAYGIILGTPAVPDMVKQALGVKDIQGIPQAAMGGFMAGWGAGRGALNKTVEPFTKERAVWSEARMKARISPSGKPTTTPPWYVRILNRS